MLKGTTAEYEHRITHIYNNLTKSETPHPQKTGIYENRKYPHHCTHAYSTDATVGCKNKEIDLSFTSKISWIDHDPSLHKNNKQGLANNYCRVDCWS